MNEKNQLRMVIAEISDFIEDILPHRIFRRLLLLLGGFGIVAIFSGLVWWYMKSEREAAYNDLSYLMLDFKNAKESIDTDWQAFQGHFLAEQVNRSKAKNSPYLALLHADLLIQQGEVEQARVLLEEQLPKFSKSPIFSHIQTLYALLLLDGTQADQDRGLSLLQEVAHNETDYAADYAAYQLGYYHFVRAEFAQAKTFWQPMIDRSLMAERGKSVWASRAEEKVNQIP